MTTLTAPRRPIVALLAAAFVVSAFGASVALSAAACTPPSAGDDISLMDENERRVFDGRPCNAELASYEKYFIPFDEHGMPGTPIRLTHRATASAGGPAREDLVALQVGKTDDHGLYLSLTASRNTGTSYCSNWSFNGYFRWNNPPTNGKNIAYDFWGMTWAGNQALTSAGAAYGIDNIGTRRNHAEADITANEGIVWRFKEWPSSPPYYVKHGYAGQSVRQTKCQGLSGNVVLKYIHTYSDATYSVGVGAGNPGSISISPTSNQWSFAVATSFSY